MQQESLKFFFHIANLAHVESFTCYIINSHYLHKETALIIILYVPLWDTELCNIQFSCSKKSLPPVGIVQATFELQDMRLPFGQRGTILRRYVVCILMIPIHRYTHSFLDCLEQFSLVLVLIAGPELKRSGIFKATVITF